MYGCLSSIKFKFSEHPFDGKKDKQGLQKMSAHI